MPITPITTTQRVFERLLQQPKTLLILALALIVALGFGLANVSKDPSVDAFVASDHPAAVARDRAAALFDVEDPIVVALVSETGESLFEPGALQALAALDAAVRDIEGVKRNGVLSLASQNAIRGIDGDLAVDPVVDIPVDAASAWQRFQSMPMLTGTLASANGDTLILIVPVDDPNHAEVTVRAVRELAFALVGDHADVHVAGVAAMNARLAQMVDTDTRLFVPAAIIVVMLILLIALRRFAALTGPLLVIAGSAAMAIGTMGWLDARYYLITTALPVVIMAIAVADTLHLCTYYLRERAQHSHLDARRAVLRALDKAWLPITLTSVTTIAAFIGLSFGAAMRPISEFGIFAAVGVAAAWLLSLTALPAILILTDLTPSKGNGSIARAGWSDRLTSTITDAAFSRPVLAISLTVLLFTGMLFFAKQAEFDYERKKYFTANDAVLVADQTINERLGGINYLDVVVSRPNSGSLMTTDVMHALADLRTRMTRLPFVEKVSSIDEYIAHMHTALTGAERGELPEQANAPAQYLFLYEASAPPEDFDHLIDYDHTEALIRARLSTDNYQMTSGVVTELERLLHTWSAEHQVDATISGRIAVNRGWMDVLANNHFVGLGAAMALVLLTTLFVFRAPGYALMAMVPVIVGVTSVYTTMGLFGLDIAPATSMTAAIATGLGVDFGIHLIALIRRQRTAGKSTYDAFSQEYLVVARACFYSAVALGVALAVICISTAPVLRWFGFLVSVGAFGSLIGAMVIVPALWSVIYNTTERNTSYAVSF